MALTLRNRFSALAKSEVSLVSGNVLTQAEISAVDKEIVKTIRNNIAQEYVLAKDEIVAVVEILSFEGFDPNIVYSHIAAIRNAKSLKWDDVKTDLLILLTVHHLKGNVNTNNMKSFKPEAKNLVNELLTKYNIVLSKDVSKKLAVTLPRLGACFPFQTAQIADYCNRDFSGFCDSSNLPACMKSSSFPSLIPRGECISLLLNVAYNAYATDQAAVIKKMNYLEMKENDRKKLFTDQQRFSDISFNSPVIDEMHRKAAVFDLKLGSSEVYNKLKSVLKYSSVDSSSLCSETEYVSAILQYQKESSDVAANIATRLAQQPPPQPPQPPQPPSGPA